MIWDVGIILLRFLDKMCCFGDYRWIMGKALGGGDMSGIETILGMEKGINMRSRVDFCIY